MGTTIQRRLHLGCGESLQSSLQLSASAGAESNSEADVGAGPARPGSGERHKRTAARGRRNRQPG